MTCCVRDSELSVFESLVFSQKPASQPWEPVTDYSFEARKVIEGQHPDLIVSVLEPSSVLDVGCGPGHLLRLLADRGVLCRGLDIAAPRSNHGESFIESWDISTPTDTGDDYIPNRWCADVVICREVLEHLTLKQQRWAISNLCLFSERLVYVTTRFSSEHDLLRVETHDDLDPTHITLASKDLIRLLFALEGFRRRADLEERMDWKKLNRCLVYERAV